MSSIKVVDVNNNEEVKQEEPTEQIEETASGSLNSNSVGVETKEEVNEVVEEPAIEQESKTEQVEEVCKEVKPVAQKVKAQDKLVRCPKCSREMKLKSYRYGHEQKCQGTLEQKPVKPFSKPRAKPKPQPIIKEEEVEEAQPKPKPKLTQEVKNQVLKPRSAGLPSGNLPQSLNLVDFSSHYQLLQNQFIQQKKETYNNLCQSMFSTKSKKW